MYRPMSHTPCFPAWCRWFGRSTSAHPAVRACTLCELEERFGPCVPPTLFPKAAAGRDRIYTPWRTFWCVLWQALQPGASGREVVRQLQALFVLEGGPRLSAADGGYCRARGRLPAGEFAKALQASASAADRRAGPWATPWLGRPLKVLDGSTLTLPDTPKNRAAYPAVQSPPPNFPLMRIIVLFSLTSGAVLALAQGSLRQSELALCLPLCAQLARGDIVVGDRGFGSYVMVALFQGLGVDFVGRTTRRLDARRRTRRWGRHDWLTTWTKPAQPSRWLPAARWAGLPAELTLRVVRGRVACPGYRVRSVTVITTLLDPARYPAEAVLQAYLRRWRLEMCLDDLKTTLRLDALRGRTPDSAQQEVLARLIGHNLVRWTMVAAGRTHAVALERISFKGTVDAVRHFSAALSRTRQRTTRAALWAELLRTLANDLVPERTGRREPRAVKRQRNKYPRLSRPRHLFRDHLKRNRRRTRGRYLGLK